MDELTATEIQFRMQEVQPHIDKGQRELDKCLSKMIEPLYRKYLKLTGYGEVCARRARKLRKRGELVTFSHRAFTGKARYHWLKKSVSVL